jgi:hypothetical protein
VSGAACSYKGARVLFDLNTPLGAKRRKKAAFQSANEQKLAMLLPPIK